jgi:hypothetical protein
MDRCTRKYRFVREDLNLRGVVKSAVGNGWVSTRHVLMHACLLMENENNPNFNDATFSGAP